jgi:hypothetical protein
MNYAEMDLSANFRKNQFNEFGFILMMEAMIATAVFRIIFP